jgi:streptogramin lyase
LDGNQQWLYVVDHGNQRVIRIDITTGSDQGGAPNYPINEPLAEYTEYTGYVQETVVTGLLKPAGIDVIGNRMIVSEHQTGEIILYDISTMPAVELERISTGYSSVQGIKVGPNGLIWFVDENSNGVYRINAGDLSIGELALDFEIFPNPTEGTVHVGLSQSIEGALEIHDIQGQLIQHVQMHGQSIALELNISSGMYFVSTIQNGVKSKSKRLIIK